MDDQEGPSEPGLVASLPGYSALEEIGRGGFSIVYRARQEQFSRQVAIKVLSVDHVDDATRRRFARECAVMGALSWHPHIVVVYDTGEAWGGRPYLVMEYLPKGSLADRLRTQGPLEWDEATRLGVQLAGALETAHQGGVLHRDVKPANAFVDLYGQAKLGDFGIANIAGGNETTTGHSAFTVLHAAPEVLTGYPATARSDVYSLASTVYTLVTGAAAFHRTGDENVAAALLRAINDPIPDLRTIGVPDDFAALIESGMAKDPDVRPTAGELGDALRDVQDAHGLPRADMWLHPERSAEASEMGAGAGLTEATGDGDHTVPGVRTPTAVPVAPGSPADSPDGGETVVGAGKGPTVLAPPGVAPAAGGADAGPTAPPAPPASPGRRRWPLLVAAAIVVLGLGAAAALVLGGSDDDGDSEVAAQAAADGSGATQEEVAVHEVVRRPISLEQGDAVRVLVTPEGAFDPVVTLAAPYDGLAADERFEAASFATNTEDFFDDLTAPACEFGAEDGSVADAVCPPGTVLPGFVADDGAAGEQEIVAAFAPVAGEYEVLVRGAGNSSGAFTLDVKTAAAPRDFSIDDFFAEDQVPFYSAYLTSEQSFFCSRDGVDDTTEFVDHEASLIVFCDEAAFDAAFGDG